MQPSSVSNFQTWLTAWNPVNRVLVPGSGVQAISPGDLAESEIDLEYSSGIAQNANIYLVYAGSNQNYSVFDALSFAITENIAPVVSISYGSCEPLMSATELDAANAVYEEASAQGQTLVASSGDSGSTSCAPFTSPDGGTPAEQQELAVNFPASSPYVTAVGGTQMAAGTFASGSNTYWSSPLSTRQRKLAAVLCAGGGVERGLSCARHFCRGRRCQRVFPQAGVAEHRRTQTPTLPRFTI